MLTTTIVAPPSNASKWQMGFNSAFKGLSTVSCLIIFIVRPIKSEDSLRQGKKKIEYTHKESDSK